MKIKICAAAITIALLGLSCGGGSPNGPRPNANIRFVQGAPDINNVSLALNGQEVASNVAPGEVVPTPTTNYLTGPSGNVNLEVTSANSSTAPTNAQVPLSANAYYTVFMVGEQSNGSLAELTLADDHTLAASGQIKVRLVHGSSTLGPVDVYFGSSINGALPSKPDLPGFAYKNASAYLTFPASTAAMCVTPAGTNPGTMDRCLVTWQFTPSSTGGRATTIFVLDPGSVQNPGGYQNFVSQVWRTLPY